MKDIFAKIAAWYDSTHLHEQIKDVDYVALFTNPWFIVPFAALIIYFIFRKKWKDIIIISAMVGVWWVSGTDYMHSLVINDIVQIDKILPVVFGGAAVLGLVIYLLFGRSD